MKLKEICGEMYYTVMFCPLCENEKDGLDICNLCEARMHEKWWYSGYQVCDGGTLDLKTGRRDFEKDDIPPGYIINYGGNDTPEKYIEMNGQWLHADSFPHIKDVLEPYNEGGWIKIPRFPRWGFPDYIQVRYLIKVIP